MSENEFTKGDLVTVVRDRERYDQSYRGEPFEVLHSEGRFVIIKTLELDPPSFREKPTCLSIDRWELSRITPEFVDAYNGARGAKCGEAV